MKLQNLFIAIILCPVTSFAQNIQIHAPGYTASKVGETASPIGIDLTVNGDIIIANTISPPRELSRMILANGQYVSDSVIIAFSGNDHRPEYILVDDDDNVFFARPDFNDGDLYMLNSSNNIQTVHVASANEFKDPRGLAFNASGDLFVANHNSGNGSSYVSKYVLNSSNVSTSSTIALVDNLPSTMDIEFDHWGNLFIVAKDRVIKVTFEANGDVDSVYNPFVSIPSQTSGNSFSTGIAIDASGDIFISQHNSSISDSGKVFHIDSTGNLTLFASGFDRPRDLDFDSENRLYVSDRANSAIYMIECSADITEENYFCSPEDTTDTLIGIQPMPVTDLDVFPNPIQSGQTLHLDALTEGRLRLIDGMGRIVLETHVSRSRSNIQLPALQTGVYTVALQNNKAIRVTRLMIQ